mmetsp:Transcript_16442/g.22944  ORF Transcript_16442/g.22944 Transcript_16442/m.22944 type:complete len:394 (-) Transcript_16442:180-1361(-)|eukprot:CAMPEP_0184486868 /NCGR_PEP_ID=MMETSP0113_2-20130426/8760_1 /TAXON_ID=91329 /ORGANISM="Norrisiella sphaerica, Strain BC52" /LENGTH=393 /DNA_ID=CAMNT_0026868935 /DNA_START=202 /DNA_END=1383 /DNA_ORIENTATION=-
MSDSSKKYDSFEGDKSGRDDGPTNAKEDAGEAKGKGSSLGQKAKDFFGCMRDLTFHAAYILLATVIICFLKAELVDQNRHTHLGIILCGRHMTKLWVTILGIVFPFFLTLRALITLETDDDRYWLNYWTVYAFYTFLTILFEEILFEDEWLWYAIQGSIYVWLYCPFLHGCTLISTYVLKPFVLPLIFKVTEWLKRNFTVAIILGSVVNIAFVSILFLFLIPYCSTYIGVTLVGITYPFLCSLAVISDEVESPNNDNKKDGPAKVSTEGTARDTQWLTYWFIFAIVHFLDVWYDNLLDHSYWFRNFWYKFALPFVVWLQIPFFHGAEYIFLHIICPAFGLHVHRFQYTASPWESRPRDMNYITYSKNISGFVNLVQNNFDGAAEAKGSGTETA